MEKQKETREWTERQKRKGGGGLQRKSSPAHKDEQNENKTS